jgi:hypothetical protein
MIQTPTPMPLTKQTKTDIITQNLFNINKIILTLSRSICGGLDIQKQICSMHLKGVWFSIIWGHGGEDGLSSERI